MFNSPLSRPITHVSPLDMTPSTPGHAAQISLKIGLTHMNLLYKKHHVYN